MIESWIAEFPQDEVALVLPRDHLRRARDLPAVTTFGTVWRPHGVAAALDLPRLARRFGADWTVTHNFTPVRGRSAVFVHDLLFRSDPHWFTAAERLYFAMMPPLLRRAEIVFTSSRSEAARITRFASPRRPVVAVGICVPPALRAAGLGRRPAELHGIEEFVLTVGRLNARKNLATTIAAALASGRLTPELPLVVVGSADGV